MIEGDFSFSDRTPVREAWLHVPGEKAGEESLITGAGRAGKLLDTWR
jgi:hypothetical protein